jgi:eukaryotic-like serine/threonine-protein kinase
MTSSPSLGAGQALGNYRIVRLIGKGGMGAVYEAFHPILKRRFAIKALPASAAKLPEARARFLREAEAVGRIGHPNVVQVSDVEMGGDTPYLVMEYLEGQTLADFFAERGRLEIELALDLLLPVFAGVAAGHAQGVIHRDLKPANIFLAYGPQGELTPKVLDFGVSRLLDDDSSVGLTGPQAVLGTAAYMSPEQARGAREVDPLSDQYALGLLLYEALTGSRAHPGQNALEILHNIAHRPIPRLRHMRPDCPQGLEDILMRMLSPAPEYRFPSLVAAAAALLEFASAPTRLIMARALGEPLPEPPMATGTLSGHSEATTMAATRGPHRRVRALGAAALALSLAGGGLWLWRGRARPPQAPAPAASALPENTSTRLSDPRPPDALAAEPDPPAKVESPAVRAREVEPPRRKQRPSVSRARPPSQTDENVFDRRASASVPPRRGANDALILE